MSRNVRLSPTHERLLRVIHEDESRLRNMPKSQRRVPTIMALLRLGMIKRGVKRQGGGIYSGVRVVTEEGLRHV